MTQKKVTKICKEVLGAALDRDMKERKLVFDRKKLEQLDKLFNLSLEVKALGTEGMTEMTDMTHIELDRLLLVVASKPVEENSNNNLETQQHSILIEPKDEVITTSNVGDSPTYHENPSHVSYLSFKDNLTTNRDQSISTKNEISEKNASQALATKCQKCGESLDPNPFYHKLHTCK